MVNVTSQQISNDVSSNRVPKKVSRWYRQPPSPKVLHSESCLPLRFLEHRQSLKTYVHLVGGLAHFIFSKIYGMWSFPLTYLYFSRWFKHVKTTNQSYGFPGKKSSMARSSSFSAVDAEDFQGLKLSNISWKHWTEITSDDQHLVQVIKKNKTPWWMERGWNHIFKEN